MDARKVGVLSLCAALLGACGGGGDGPGPAGERLHAASRCDVASEAPLRDGAGGFACIPVGADPSATPGFPSVEGHPTPVVYVSADATGGGDGSEGSPLTLAEALDLDPIPGTLALEAGEYEAGDVTLAAHLVGAGPDTLLRVGEGGVTIAGGADVRLERVGIVGPSDLVAVPAGASASLRDVALAGAERGVVVGGGAVELDRVTIEEMGFVGLFLDSGSATITRSRLVGEGLHGIIAMGGALDISESLVADHERDGIALLGGGTHRLSMVTSTRNGVTGLRVEGAGTSATGALLSLTATHVPAGLVGGDGLYVADGATLELDAGMASDETRGHGSEIVGNARTGVLVSGMEASFELAGALVGSNEGPGAFVQLMGQSPSLGYSVFDDNGALGIGVASAGHVQVIPCNLITGTFTAELVTQTTTLELGDGLSMAEGPSSSTEIVGNEVSDNARFGVLLSGANAVMRDNTGSGNGYGVGSYIGELDQDASNSVTGARPAPTSDIPVAARGAVGIAPTG